MDDLIEIDPFDLPEWLGVGEVTWAARAGLRTGYVVRGDLTTEGHDPLPCDLLAVDEAFPVPIAPDDVRNRTHQAWRNGEVHLLRRDGRLAVAVPGTFFTADLVLDAFARLARAVGASADRYTVLLRIGDSGR